MVVSKSVGRRAALLSVMVGLALSGCSFHYSSRSSSRASGSGKPVHGSHDHGSGKSTAKPISKGDGGGKSVSDDDPPAKGVNPEADPPTKGDNDDEATPDPHRTKPAPHRTKPAATRKPVDPPADDPDAGNKSGSNTITAKPKSGGGGAPTGDNGSLSTPK